MSLEKDTKGPAVKFPPPLMFLCFIVLAGLLQRSVPLSLPDHSVFDILGVLIFLAGLVLGLSAKRGFDKVGTDVEPWKPTTSIVSDGIFAYSRNPIYVAFCLVTIGVGLVVASVWILLSFLPAAVAVYFVAIVKEEAYLERKFSDEYLAYKRKVRRWL